MSAQLATMEEASIGKVRSDDGKPDEVVEDEDGGLVGTRVDGDA
jgi:hypothetical protein